MRSLSINFFTSSFFTSSFLVLCIGAISAAQTNPAVANPGVAPAVANSGVAQSNAAAPDVPAKAAASSTAVVEPLIALRATSTTNLSSELGGAFLPPVKCDPDGNLYIRRFAANRPRGPVIKIDSEGKPAALFDPAVFGSLGLDRVDAFSPAPDGGIYQIAQKGVIKPLLYVLHYSSDGSAASPSKLDADFEVYTFAAFPDGSFLISGTQRDPMDKNDHGRGITEVFSADGRELAQVTFQEPKAKARKSAASAVKPVAESGAKSVTPSQQVATYPPAELAKPAEKTAGALDLKDAEVSRDGNLFVMRTSSQALVDVISPSGKIFKTLKIVAPLPDLVPNSFHVSENRLALLFSTHDEHTVAVAVADAQTGRKIAAYSGSSDWGTFACYSANDSVFTFLKHGDGNVITVIRAEAQ